MTSDVAAAVLDARDRIRSHIRTTECRFSQALSTASGAEIFLKLENLQLSGSFKLRGVFNKLLTLSPNDRAKRLVAASTGNHGAAFARAVSELDLDGLLFLPRNVSPTKLAAIKEAGIPYELVGDDCVNTEIHAARFAVDNDAVWIPPYNDEHIVAGQGTIAVELLDQLGDFDRVLVPVGGGGLISGIAGYLAATAPDVRVVGCQPEASPVMFESVRAGTIVAMESRPTLSDATAGGIEPGAITFELCRRYVDDFELLSEEEIAAAIRWFHEHERTAIEGAAALPVAVALRRPAQFRGAKLVVVITGSRIDAEVLERVLS